MKQGTPLGKQDERQVLEVKKAGLSIQIKKSPLYVLSFSLQKLILSGVGWGGESVCYLVGKDQSNFHKDSATCRKQLTTPKGPGK